MDLPAAISQEQPADPPDPTPAEWPSVSDYWPDDPPGPRVAGKRDTKPARQPDDDGITWIGDSTPGSPGGAQGRRALFVLGCALAAAVLVVTGAVMATLIKQAHQEPENAAAASQVSPGDGAEVAAPSTPVPSLDTGAASLAPAPPPTTTATTQPPSRPAAAIFELASVAPAVTMHTRDIGTDLYRVTIANGSTAESRITSSGTVFRLSLTHNGKTVQAPVDITLSSSVRWTVRMTGGAAKDVLNLADSRLAAVELAAGATLIELTLPPASDTLAVRVTKGINELRVRTAKNDPVRLDLRAGAGQVLLAGRTRNGVAANAVLTTAGWADARNRVDLLATAGLGVLVVTDG